MRFVRLSESGPLLLYLNYFTRVPYIILRTCTLNVHFVIIFLHRSIPVTDSLFPMTIPI